MTAYHVETVWEGADELRPVLVPLDELRPHPDNPRRGDVEEIRGSLRRFGQQRPILATADGMIVAGHHVYEAATLEGWTHVAATVTDLTGDEITAYLLADNRTGDLGYYDEDELAARLGSLHELAGTGYTDDDKHALLDSLAPPDALLPAPRQPGPEGQPAALGTATEFNILLTYTQQELASLDGMLDDLSDDDETDAAVIRRLLAARA